MYSIEFRLKNERLSIPIDKYRNKHNDIHLFSIIKPQLHKIYGFLFNKNDIFEGVTICLLDDNNVIASKTINPKNKIICTFGGFKPDSNLNIELTIESLFSELEAYIITIKDGEIFKVTLNDKDIDVNWFIENVYKKDTGRYYRKFSTFLNIKVFKRDVE